MAVFPSDPSWEFLSYPFTSHFLVPESADRAFKGKSKGPTLHCYLMYGFVSAPSYKVFKHLNLIEGFGDGEKFTPNIDERSVRDVYTEWRTILFSNRSYLGNIFVRMITSLDATLPYRDHCTEMVKFILENGIFSNLSDEELTRRRLLWDNVRTCLKACPNGLNTTKLTRKYGGYTQFDSHMAMWRHFIYLVVDRSENPNILKDEEAALINWMKTEENERFGKNMSDIRYESNKKVNCKVCKFPNLKVFLPFIIEEIISYTSKYNTTNIDTFYKLFVSGFIYGWVRFEGSFLIHYINDSYKRAQTLGLDELTDARAGVGSMHKNYIRFVNAISHIMIEHLAVEKA